MNTQKATKLRRTLIAPPYAGPIVRPSKAKAKNTAPTPPKPPAAAAPSTSKAPTAAAKKSPVSPSATTEPPAAPKETK